MPDKAKLADVRAILGLQSARVVAARDRLSDAATARDKAADRTHRQMEACDAAYALWNDKLCAPHPDPQFLAVAGQWMVYQDGLLTAARLDEEIAEHDRDAAARACAEAMARRDIAGEMATTLRRQIARGVDEREALAAGDRFLARLRA